MSETCDGMKLKTLFLVISLVAFAIGFVDAGESIFWYMGLPVGAIFFMLFMVFMVLEKESALLDQQTREAAEEQEKFIRQTAGTFSRSSNKEHCAPVLTTASSH